jgi:uncharacterized protein (TIGR04255 family)
MLIVNQLPPYPGWEDFFALITKIFSEYLELIGDFSLDRIDLRYINKIFLPVKMEGNRIEDFITVISPLEGDIDRPLLSFNQRYDISYNYPEAILIHQTALAQEDDKSLIILDLDFFSETVKSINQITEIQAWLDQSHIHIYKAFISSLNSQYYQRIREGQIEL